MMPAGVKSKCRRISCSSSLLGTFPVPNVSIMIETFGTGKVPNSELEQLIRRHFDFTPAGIIKYLDLRRPFYRKTAAYGHFGRSEPEFTWERTNRIKDLRDDAGV